MRHRSETKARRHNPRRKDDLAATQTVAPYDLKFVPIVTGKRRAGGWYRELPDHQLEVMSRGQLERVPLENEDPEEKAKSVVRDILRRHH
jgi:hypothetical protein